MRLKKLHILLLKQYLGPLVATFFVVLFLVVMQFLWKYIDDLAGKGLEMSVIAQLFFYASITFIPMALPLSILLSSLMTMGNLGEYFELTAMKASGISLQRILRPLIVLSILISLSAFFFSNYVIPVANLKMLTLLHDVRAKKPAFNIKEGEFYNGLSGYSIRVNKKDRETGRLYDIKIYNHTNRRKNTWVVVADSGEMHFSPNKQYLLLTLMHGKKYEEIPEDLRKKGHRTYPAQKDFFDKEVICFDLSAFKFKRSDESLWKKNYQMLNVRQLRYAIDSLSNNLKQQKYDFSHFVYQSNYLLRYPVNRDSLLFKLQLHPTHIVNYDSLYASLAQEKQLYIINLALNNARNVVTYLKATEQNHHYSEDWIVRHEIEWHRKYTLSIACFILFFIGAPLGAIIRKGGFGLPMVISVLFFVIYYVMSMTGERLANEGVINPTEGMWLASAILLPIGIFLTIKATNDSKLISLGWPSWIMSIFKKKRTTNEDSSTGK